MHDFHTYISNYISLSISSGSYCKHKITQEPNASVFRRVMNGKIILNESQHATIVYMSTGVMELLQNRDNDAIEAWWRNEQVMRLGSLLVGLCVCGRLYPYVCMLMMILVFCATFFFCLHVCLSLFVCLIVVCFISCYCFCFVLFSCSWVVCKSAGFCVYLFDLFKESACVSLLCECLFPCVRKAVEEFLHGNVCVCAQVCTCRPLLRSIKGNHTNYNSRNGHG